MSTRRKAPSVCLIDFDLQFGSVATYLDLPRRDIVLEFLQEAETMDVDTFRQALVSYGDKLSVFTAPPEIVPLDIMGAGELNAILDLAQQCFDIVIVEMPRTLVVWSEAVLNRADIFFATLELDLRSAQDAMRFIKALRAEDLPLEKIQYVMNRAPGGMDLTGKGRSRNWPKASASRSRPSCPMAGRPCRRRATTASRLPKPQERTRCARKS
jgi:pilus assembly protein CpaE